MKTYPIIQFNNNSNNQGSLQKHVLLHKSFLATKRNTIFVADKEPVQISTTTNTRYKSNGYLLEILLHGLNYSAKRLRLSRFKYFIDMHKSEISIYNEPVAKPYRSRIHKRRLIFFSYDSQLLNKISSAIKKLKLPSFYTGKGIFSRHDSYIVKRGKKR